VIAVLAAAVVGLLLAVLAVLIGVARMAGGGR
jgi:hypothetical protein